MDLPSASSALPISRDRARRPSILLLGLLTALDAMAIDSYLPALPAIARDLNVAVVETQATLGVFLLGLAIGQAVWGPISDRLGRRWPIIAGLVVYCLGSLGGAVAPSIGFLVASRLLQAIGASAGLVLSRAIISDLWDSADAPRLYSIMMQILGITALFSPLLGGGLLIFGNWRLIFVVLLTVGLLTGCWSFFGIAESLPPARRAGGGGLLAGYGRLLRTPSFLLATLAAAMSMATMFATLAGSSFLFVDRFGWSSTQFSFLYASSSIAFVIVCQINNGLLRRMKDTEVLKIGVGLQLIFALVMMGLAVTGAAQAWSFALLWLALIANLGIVLGNAVSAAMHHAIEGCAGAASAMVGIAQFGLSALLSPLAGASRDLVLSFSATTAGCAALAWGLTLLALRSRPRKEAGI